MPVMEDRMTPVRSSSMSVASLVSSGVGARVMDETVGVDTQDGGPKVSEYPGRTLVMLPSCWGLL